MGTADEQRGGSYRERQRSAGAKPLWWDDGTDEERRVEGEDSSPLLRRCSRAPSCATVTLRHSLVC